MKQYSRAIIIWIIFEAIAVMLWLTRDNFFYLLNFSYIGTCLAVGLFLYARKIKYARNVIQFAIGSYMLVYLGILSIENMRLRSSDIICFWAFFRPRQFTML